MQPVLGIACKIVSTLAFVLMSACLKLSSQFPPGELMFFRSVFAMIPLLLWIRWQGSIVEAIRTKSVFGHFLRSITGTASMFCSFTALRYLPLTDAIALGYATPIMAVLLAALVLKEVVRGYHWTAVLIGLIGVLIMLWPHLSFHTDGGEAEGALTGVVLALSAAFLSAAAAIQIRRLTKTERVGAIVFYFFLISSLISLCTILLGWRLPNASEFWILFLAGILGGIGQILLTESYSLADMSVIVPFEYSSMIWTVVLGWFVFGEIPSVTIVSGGIVVALSGIFILWCERKVGFAHRKAAHPAPPAAPVIESEAVLDEDSANT